MELQLQVRVHSGDGEKGRGGVPDPGLPCTKSCAPPLPRTSPGQTWRVPGSPSTLEARTEPLGAGPAEAIVCPPWLPAGSRLARRGPGSPYLARHPRLSLRSRLPARRSEHSLGQRSRSAQEEIRLLGAGRRGGGRAGGRPEQPRAPQPRRGGPAPAALRAQARTTFPRRRRRAGLEGGGRGEGGASLAAPPPHWFSLDSVKLARGGAWRRDPPCGQLAVCLPD